MMRGMSNAIDCQQCGLKLDLRSDDNFNSDHTAIICPRCGSKECAVSVEVHNLTTHDIQLSPTGEFIIGPEKSAIAKEATAAGFKLESWMTSPPKPAMMSRKRTMPKGRWLKYAKPR